jgi:hypothetical protein
MKVTWRNQLFALWAILWKKRTQAKEIQGLQIYRFNTTDDFNQRLPSVNAKLLAFFAFEDLYDIKWFSVAEIADALHGLGAKATKFNMIVVDREMLTGQQKGLLNLMLNNLKENKSLFQLDKDQQEQWLWITEKIECTLAGDYIFWKEYLQELLLQAIHFTLKLVMQKRADTDTFYPITISMNDQDVPEEYVNAFNHSLTLSAN